MTHWRRRDRAAHALSSAASTTPSLVAPQRGLRFLLLCCLCLALALGAAKLLIQREHPPEFTRFPANVLHGWVAIDGYGQRAELLRDWIAAEPGSGEALRAALRNPLHPTSWLVPALVALVSFATRSVPLAFALLSWAALAAHAWLAVAVARRLAPGASASVPWIAGCLVAAHCLCLRTAAQLMLDPFAAACAAACLVLALDWTAHGGTARALGLHAVQAAGLFVKDSYVPWLAAPALIALCAAGLRARRTWSALGLMGVLPLLWPALFLAWHAGLAAALHDLRYTHSDLGMDRRQLAHFGVEMALLLQVFPLAIWAGRRGSSRAELGVGLALLVVLATTWAQRLPPIPRVYLPCVAPLVVLAVVASERVLRDRARRRWLAALLLGNVGVAAAGLWSLAS